MSAAVSSRPDNAADRLSAWAQLSRSRLLVGLFSACAALIGMVPIVAITQLIATTGGNNLSSDDIVFVTRFIGPIFAGTYQWRGFLLDTFYNTHSLVFPALVYIGAARFAELNIYAILLFGIALTVVRLGLLYLAFTNQAKSVSGRLALFPLLAALVFSLSQISVFEHGLINAPMALNQLGVALAIWGMVRFRRRWAGAIIMVVGGVLATFSFGSGLIAWPAFFLGLVLLGYDRFRHYALWLGAALASGAVYAYCLAFQRSAVAVTQLVSFFNYRFILNALGWPMANGLNANFEHNQMAAQHGALGIVLCVLGLAVLWRRRAPGALERAAAPLMVLVFSLLCIWQISLFRTQIAPWYTTTFMNFWIGLLGLAYVLWSEPALRFGRLWAALCVVALVACYLRSNLTYQDKTIFLATRTPVSEACVRNYRSAPTYCERTLVIWQLGNTQYIKNLAEPLERDQLSAFAPHQEWALQGDFVLDTVRVGETAATPDIFWSADATANPVPFWDYRHLNLFLHTPNKVEWTVSFPPNTRDATFFSAATMSESAPVGGDGATVEVWASEAGRPEQNLFSQTLAAGQRDWQPFSIPLSQYAGKTITLRLTSNAGANNVDDWLMLRYPRIDVSLAPGRAAPPTAGYVAPQHTKDDLLLPVTSAGDWQAAGLQAASGAPGTWVVAAAPSLTYAKPLDVCLADYSHIAFRMAASPEIYPRAAQIFYRLDGEPDFSALHSVTIPLLPDGEIHEYGYDLKLLELGRGQRLSGLKVAPVAAPAASGANQVRIEDFRLIRAAAGGCAK